MVRLKRRWSCALLRVLVVGVAVVLAAAPVCTCLCLSVPVCPRCDLPLSIHSLRAAECRPRFGRFLMTMQIRDDEEKIACNKSKPY